MFIPLAISLGAERLMAHRKMYKSGMHTAEKKILDTQVQGCLEVLRKMQSVNNLAKYHLQLLESDDLTAHPLIP